MIKISNKKIIEVNDFDKFVEKTYNKIYSFQQQEGCKDRGMEYFIVPIENPENFENTEIPFEVNGKIMGISFETWLKTSIEDTEENFNPAYKWENRLFWERNFYPHIDMILNDLYNKGLIEAGEYGINIDW